MREVPFFPPLLNQFIQMGTRGVDLFFVLSGYLVGTIAFREFNQFSNISLLNFWRRRWFRTLPAYYVTLGFYVIKSLLPHSTGELENPLSYLIFLQTYLSLLSHFVHSWSLCVEEHFYLFLPLFLNLLGICFRNIEKHIAWILIALFFGMIILQFMLSEAGSQDPRNSIWRTDAITMGVLIASL